MSAPGKRRRWLEWFGLVFIVVLTANLVWGAFVYFTDYEDPSLRNTVEKRMEFCGAVVYEKTGSNSNTSRCVEKDEDGHWRNVNMRFDSSLCPDVDHGMDKRECYVIEPSKN